MASANVGELQIGIKFDAKGLSSSIKSTGNEIDRGGKEFGAKWQTSMALIQTITTKVFDKVTSAISGSIDTAIKRIDTLNNSTVVFEAMGYQADDVAKSMSTLNTYLDGLPTSMTDAINGVQALSASFGGIEKGTEYFVAMNDAGLAFGASSDMISNAITQIGQLSLDGPLDAATWNSLQNSGFGPVFAALAKEAGVTVGELKADFGGKGTKTVQDFLDSLVRLDKEGSGSMESLSSIARKNTNGIGTAIENVQNRIAKAIAKVIDEIGADNISNAINDFSASFTNVADVVVGAIKWIGENAEWLVPLVGGIVAAFMTYEAVCKTVTIAQGIMNAVMEANPISIIIAAVVGLIAGLVLLWNNCEGFRNFIMGAVETIGQAIGAAGEFIGGIFTKIGEIATSIFQAIWDFIKPIIDAIVGAFENLWNAIKTIFEAIWNIVKTVFEIAWSIISTVIQNVVTIFENLWKIISGIFQLVWDTVSSVFENVWSIISGVVDKVKDAFQGAWNFITGIFGTVGGWFRDRFNEAFEAIKGIFSGIGNFFKGIWDTITGVFSSIGTKIGDAVSGAFKGVVNTVLGGVESILNVPIRGINALIGVINAIPGIELGYLSEFSLPRMATGGIVPGTSYSGDHNMIMANSGEMVITRSQQAALWDMIESGNYGYGDEDESGAYDNDGREVKIIQNNTINNGFDVEQMNQAMIAAMRGV